MIAVEFPLDEALGLLASSKPHDASAKAGRERLERAVVIETGSGGSEPTGVLPSWLPVASGEAAA